MRGVQAGVLPTLLVVCALFVTPAGVAAQERKRTRPESQGSDRSTEDAQLKELTASVEKLRQMMLEQKRELEAQRALIEAQQARIARFEARSATASSANGEGGSAPDGLAARTANKPADQEDLAQKVKSLEVDVSHMKKSTEGKLKNLGNFSFSGDFRGRFESFNGGTLSDARYRERIRLRFNVNARFNDEIKGGFTLASGDLTDPISTNQSLTGFYERKPIAIDKAYLTYTPKWFAPLGNLSITGGKFGYTWYRTELTTDNDLNVEGISPTLSWSFENPLFKGITLVGFTMPFNESSSSPDSFLSGGQIQTHWQLGDRVRLGTYVGFMDFNGADRIRAAQTTGDLSGSSNSNAATSTQFASKFGLLDAILRADIKTPWSRWPMMLQFDYVNNTRACTNLVNISGTLPACNPRDRDGYWAEVQFGQTKERGDVNFGYSFIRIEREAILAVFNFSDLRAPSNILTHRLNINYQAYKNITLGWTGLFGRQLVTTGSPTKEDILRRMQLDFVYKF